ncbi:MAG: acetyl-CoA carboxylase biotin carboxyl carrier protein [Nitrospinota bacterium]|nr:acetyl-CoA carboxylase biotin carboxyl carrier protein [Nitrospinota bacterium]
MDLNEIKKLIDIFEKSDLNELEIEKDNSKVRLRKGGGFIETAPAVRHAAVPAPATPKAAATPKGKVIPEGDNYIKINSPMVGTFYRSPGEGEDPYVKEGDMVQKGQVLCIVEAMKLMNEIEAEASGKIISIVAENAAPVEYDETLFVIEK